MLLASNSKTLWHRQRDCPLNPESHFTNGYAVIFGDEKNPSFQADAKRGLIRVRYQYKVGLDSTSGWCLLLLRVKRPAKLRRQMQPGDIF